MVSEKWYNRMMVPLNTMLLPGPNLHCASPWQFGDFCDIFLPNIAKGQKKVLPSEHAGALARSTCASPWQFGDFCDILLPNIAKGQKKVSPSEHGALGTLPYGKSCPGYCITFIKKLDEGLR